MNNIGNKRRGLFNNTTTQGFRPNPLLTNLPVTQPLTIMLINNSSTMTQREDWMAALLTMNHSNQNPTATIQWFCCLVTIFLPDMLRTDPTLIAESGYHAVLRHHDANTAGTTINYFNTMGCANHPGNAVFNNLFNANSYDDALIAIYSASMLIIGKRLSNTNLLWLTRRLATLDRMTNTTSGSCLSQMAGAIQCFEYISQFLSSGQTLTYKLFFNLYTTSVYASSFKIISLWILEMIEYSGLSYLNIISNYLITPQHPLLSASFLQSEIHKLAGVYDMLDYLQGFAGYARFIIEPMDFKRFKRANFLKLFQTALVVGQKERATLGLLNNPQVLTSSELQLINEVDNAFRAGKANTGASAFGGTFIDLANYTTGGNTTSSNGFNDMYQSFISKKQ